MAYVVPASEPPRGIQSIAAHADISSDIADGPGWRRRTPSLHEIAEHVEAVLRDKQELLRRLEAVLRENEALNLKCARVQEEFQNEKARLHETIAGLQSQIASTTARKADGERALLAAKERLIKDECERKLQDMHLELKKERHQLQKSRELMEAQMAACICRNSVAANGLPDHAFTTRRDSVFDRVGRLDARRDRSRNSTPR